MKTYLTYGFLLALTGFLLILVLFISGLEANPANLQTAHAIGFVVSLAAVIGFLVAGIKARRSATPAAETFGYGQAFGAGFLVQLAASGFGLVGNYLYFAVINPNFGEQMVQVRIDKLEASGISGDKLDRAESMLRMFSNPVALTAAGFINSLIMGLLVALVVAAFLKRPAAENSPPLN